LQEKKKKKKKLQNLGLDKNYHGRARDDKGDNILSLSPGSGRWIAFVIVRIA